MMDDGQEMMKAQEGSIAYRIDVNQEELMANTDAQLEKMEAYPGKDGGHRFGGKSRRNRVLGGA
jgi:hypothetical protein